MAARRADTLELVRFGDALRDFLGLAPIYQDCSGGEARRSEAVRFDVDPIPESNGMTPRRGGVW